MRCTEVTVWEDFSEMCLMRCIEVTVWEDFNEVC